MTIAIRPYVPADAPVLLELFRRSVREVASADYSPEQVRAWAPDELDVETFAQRRAAAGTWVAEREGAVAGFTDLSNDGYIDMFFVHPEHARRGVATALMAHVLGEARRRGLTRLTVAASITARPLFERSGFAVVREQRVERRGQWFTNYAMQRVEGVTAADGALLARAEGRRLSGLALLDRLDVVGLLSGFGPVRVMGSVVSGLVVARDLDVAVRVGPAFAPTDVVSVLDRLVRLPRVESFTYDDERGARTLGDRLDERYHLAVRVRDDDGALWTLDLSLFLHDEHAHVAALHERLRDELTVAQRVAILRLKEQWADRPDYPGGWALCRAVLDAGAASVEELVASLAPPTR